MRRLAGAPAVALAVLVLALTVAVPAGGAVPAAVPAATVPRLSPVPGPLHRYAIAGVYVAGVSAGGYLATQLQVAYSGRIAGAAVFAAGPYYCAQDNALQALYGCADTLYPDHLATLEADTTLWSGLGWIDPVGHLAGQHVYVFHGGSDTAVRRPVTDDLVFYYRHFGAAVTYDSGSVAGHGWITPYGPGACTATAPPYLNNCGTDPQGAFLRVLLGAVSPPATGALGGTLIQFGQSTYAVNGYAPGLSMDPAGFAYVPAACAAGRTCRLLVALHGCAQGYGAVGTAFVDDANLNQYADTNAIVVLYPQAAASPVNPNGCWDWWGYLGFTSYPIHGGPQLETVMAMIRALGG